MIYSDEHSAVSKNDLWEFPEANSNLLDYGLIFPWKRFSETEQTNYADVGGPLFLRLSRFLMGNISTIVYTSGFSVLLLDNYLLDNLRHSGYTETFKTMEITHVNVELQTDTNRKIITWVFYTSKPGAKCPQIKTRNMEILAKLLHFIYLFIF